MIHDKWYMIMMISERNHIMRGRTSRKDRWSIVFETRILERESASFCTLKRLGERDRERATCDVGLCSSRGMYERESERERETTNERTMLLNRLYRDILTQQNKSRQDKTRQQREEQENKHDIGGKTLLPNDRERERELSWGTYKCFQESFYCSSALLRPPLDAAGCSIHVQIHI